MMAAMHVRHAAPSDAEALAALRWEFRSVGHGAPEEARDAFVERCAAWMRERLSSGGPWTAWVAERDGEIAGQVWVQLFEKLPNPTAERERHAYISNLYVRPAARGGTGTALLNACLAWIADQRVDAVVLWPSAASRSLYARHGFRPAGDVLVLDDRQ